MDVYEVHVSTDEFAWTSDDEDDAVVPDFDTV